MFHKRIIFERLTYTYMDHGDEDFELCQDITNVSQISSEEQKF
jgi:hypothetical protein